MNETKLLKLEELVRKDSALEPLRHEPMSGLAYWPFTLLVSSIVGGLGYAVAYALGDKSDASGIALSLALISQSILSTTGVMEMKTARDKFAEAKDYFRKNYTDEYKLLYGG